METLDNADQLLKQRKYKEAISIYEEAHQANPEEESILLRLAWAHYDSGATAPAAACLEMLLQRELQRKVFTGFAFDELVRIYKQEKNFDKLTEICTRALAVQPDDTGLLVELGNACLQGGHVREACRIYDQLVHQENDNPVFYCLLGEALFAAGLTSESEAAYLRAGEIDPDQVDHYYFKIADLFAQRGGYEEAKRFLEKCIEASPAKPIYHCCLGDALVGLGRVKEALAEYEIAVHHSNSGAYYNRFGNILAKASYHQEAVEAFRKALKIEPDNPVYARHLALAQDKLPGSNAC
jgi:tetratricopeptide (TPR) repeat protein